MCSILNRKFFGQPNGTKPPAKQSKLAFSSKSMTKKDPPSSVSSKENDDVEMKDEQSEPELKPKVEKKEDVDTEEDARPDKGAWCDRNVLE
jgi:hypothetical protein